MEATIFTGRIYDHVLPHAEQVKVAHPLMLRAIAAAKKKNDRIDASKIVLALRLSAGMPHGIHRDSRSPPHFALLASIGAADGSDEESGLRSIHGNRNESQQTKTVGEGFALWQREVSDFILDNACMYLRDYKIDGFGSTLRKPCRPMP